MRVRYAWVIVGACLTVGCGEEETDPTGGTGGAAPEGCAPGSMPTGDDANPCLPPGIPAESCAVGFTPVGDGCEVVLPVEDCAEGTMAIPGETACREIAPCGTTTWGEIPITEPGTVFVDGSYLGGDGDGTEAQPFVTIQEGVDAAAAGAIVAVAE
ncbi:MAG: hypothetical protein JRI68_30520, partial [Deltaproteobacteria bacterium]|nr:hypothetical protein [Deltaproteobacteria bacterium]